MKSKFPLLIISCLLFVLFLTLGFILSQQKPLWNDELFTHAQGVGRLSYADIVSGKIREIRVLFASQHYRLLYFFYEKTIVITGGFIKKTDVVPIQEIERAENCMIEFLNRHKEGNP